MSVRRAWNRLVWLAAAGVTLAACGQGGAGQAGMHRRASTTTTQAQTLVERYRTVVSGGDAQLQRLTSQLNTANGDIPAIQSGFRRVAATYRQVAGQVRALPFPAAMASDVTAMVSALDVLAGDSDRGAAAVSVDQFNAVFSQLAADQKTEVSANTVVNHDLGISAIS